MLYVYSPRASNGARELTESLMLAGTRSRRTKGLALRGITAQDAVICWGANVALPAGVKSLNNIAGISKFTEAQTLAAAGVPTVTVSRERPAAARAAAKAPWVPAQHRIAAQTVDVTRADQLARNIQEFVRAENARRVAWENQPAVPAETWLPRRNNHMGGADLLNPDPATANFWSRKENIVEEYRLHMFKGKSIRAGKKVQVTDREGRRITPHAWVRSYDGGWIISYAGFESTKAMRKMAAEALKALNLDFGAVDMAKKADGSLMVLEVNRAPGIEGNSITSYVKHIQAWLAGKEQAGEA